MDVKRKEVTTLESWLHRRWQATTMLWHLNPKSHLPTKKIQSHHDPMMTFLVATASQPATMKLPYCGRWQTRHPLYELPISSCIKKKICILKGSDLIKTFTASTSKTAYFFLTASTLWQWRINDYSLESLPWFMLRWRSFAYHCFCTMSANVNTGKDKYKFPTSLSFLHFPIKGKYFSFLQILLCLS